MPPKVSVVIPVYNVGKQLEKCLDSVVAQTFPDIEIIVVNDGSTDNSPEIIARYADKDSRIVVIDKSNEGLAYARKSGIEAAQGEYIQHLDGDDFLEPDAIELLYNKAIEDAADMVVFPFWFDYVDEKKKRSSRPAPGVYDSVSFFQSMAFCRNYWSVCSYLHKRSLYAEVHFEKGLNYGEDAYLASQLTYFANKIVVLESTRCYTMLFVMIPFLSDLFPKRKPATSNYIRNCNAGSTKTNPLIPKWKKLWQMSN